MVRVRVRVRVRRGLQDALDGAEVRAPEESRGRDLEGGGAQPHGDAVEQANAHGLSRSEGGAGPAEEGGAAALALSLTANRSLRTLTMPFTGLGDEAAAALAHALEGGACEAAAAGRGDGAAAAQGGASAGRTAEEAHLSGA